MAWLLLFPCTWWAECSPSLFWQTLSSPNWMVLYLCWKPFGHLCKGWLRCLLFCPSVCLYLSWSWDWSCFVEIHEIYTCESFNLVLFHDCFRSLGSFRSHMNFRVNCTSVKQKSLSFGWMLMLRLKNGFSGLSSQSSSTWPLSISLWLLQFLSFFVYSCGPEDWIQIIINAGTLPLRPQALNLILPAMCCGFLTPG